jgi:hypothetical protein
MKFPYSCEFSNHYFDSNIDGLSQTRSIRDRDWFCGGKCFLLKHELIVFEFSTGIWLLDVWWK